LKKHCSIPAWSSRLGWNVCAGAIHRAYLHAEDVRRKRQNVGADVIKKAVCISADPKDHVDLARRYIDMGFDHLIFHSAGPDQRAFLEGYGRDVLPRLREATRSKSAAASKSKPAPPDHDFIDEHNP
jgi:alkanesulfonate monooxygenase SsuD/methylene tetrahydromethanopterin reductase-like flavin-dependent oxidoreductase (luciferase family)